MKKQSTPNEIKSKNEKENKASNIYPTSVEAIPGTSRITKSQKRKATTTQEDIEHQKSAKVKRTASEAMYQNKALLTGQQTYPLFVRDIFLILRKSVIGKYKQTFRRTNRNRKKDKTKRNVGKYKHGKTILMVMEGVPENFISNTRNQLKRVINNFNKQTVFLDNIPFGQEVRNIFQFVPEIPRNDSYSVIFPADKKIQVSVSKNNSSSKLGLLTKPILLMADKYPLPADIVPFADSGNFLYTKPVYDAVSEDSPLYALDCEYNRDKLRWMALVNENHETVYALKTGGNVDDNTNISNIASVQNQLYKKLPSNAVLCGHSLNFDLRLLRTIHPYVIDSSIIYKTCENKFKLKELANVLLGEHIQTTRHHSPVEDSIATMKIIQKKQADSTNINELKNSKHHRNSFFSLMDRHSKHFAIIGRRDDIDMYTPDYTPTNTAKVVEDDPKRILQATAEKLKSNDLVLTHLNLDSNKESDYRDALLELQNSCPVNTMVTVVLAPAFHASACFRKGLFLKTVKNSGSKLRF